MSTSCILGNIDCSSCRGHLSSIFHGGIAVPNVEQTCILLLGTVFGRERINFIVGISQNGGRHGLQGYMEYKGIIGGPYS